MLSPQRSDYGGFTLAMKSAAVHDLVLVNVADQSIVAAPPQGDLASIGFQKAGITNQTEARGVGVGDRQGSVRNKRPSRPNSLVAWNVTHSMFRIC